MTLSKQTLIRLPKIKQGLIKGLTIEQISGKCGVYEKTIDRDIHAWVESGLFTTWIREEWVRLHSQIIHDDPVEAYRQVSKLVAKSIVQRAEIKSEHKEEITKKYSLDINRFNEDERNLIRKAIRTVEKRVEKTGSTSIH